MNKGMGAIVGLVMIGVVAGGYYMYRESEKERLRLAAEVDAAHDKLDKVAADAKAAQEQFEQERREILKREADCIELSQQQKSTIRTFEAEKKYKRIALETRETLARQAKSTEIFFLSTVTMKTSPTQERVDQTMLYSEFMENTLLEAKETFKKLTEFTQSEDYKHLHPAPKSDDDSFDDEIAWIDKQIAALRAYRAGVKTGLIEVRADDGWQSAPITVLRNESVLLQPSGQWQWTTQLSPKVIGPDGTEHYTEYRIEPSVLTGAAIAKIEGNEKIFRASGFFDPPSDGKLLLRINDRNLDDNSGTATIKYWIIPHFDIPDYFE